MPRPPFPANVRQFQRQFATEEACQHYLAACRWPDGFRCPRCEHERAYTAIATHDRNLIRRICDYTASAGLGKATCEFQMLYGIQRAEQLRLAREGYRSRVLIAYGPHWYPWFMRRLAERPANLSFLLRNLFSS